VSEPLTLEKDLKGRFTILDFFTYCCINCIHILAELEEIEAEFPLPGKKNKLSLSAKISMTVQYFFIGMGFL